MTDDKVRVHLNDKLVADNVPLENFRQRGMPLETSGPNELQHHGSQLWFRNFRIREVPD